MKSKSSPKRNRRTKRQHSSLRFDPLEPRQMLTFFTPGPSDAGLFDTVVTVNADDVILEDVGDNSIRGLGIFDLAAPNTQINLAEGGRIGPDADGSGSGLSVAIRRSELNITGGTLGDSVQFIDSEVNFSNGVIGDRARITDSSTTFNVTGGEIGDLLSLQSATLNFSGGVIGDNFLARGSSLSSTQFAAAVVNISGGIIGERFGVSGNSVVNIDGGVIGDFFGVSRDRSGTNNNVVNISNGEIGSNFSALGGVVNISGGTIGRGEGTFLATDGVVNLSGGVIQDRLGVVRGDFNLFVLQYELSEGAQDSPVIGETATITSREGTISGTLADGTEFSYDLAFFRETANLSVTQVTGPLAPNELGTITGDLSASGFSDNFSFDVPGQVSITGLDSDEDQFVSQIATRGTYGDFSISPEGRFNFEIDNAAVGDLFLDESISESFEIVAINGATESVTITINGALLPPASSGSLITGDLSGTGLATDSTITGVVSAIDSDGPIKVLDTASGQPSAFGSSGFITRTRIPGQQFEITTRTQVDELGALFQNLDPQSITTSAVINRLTSLSDVPDNPDLTGSDVVFSTELTIPETFAGVVQAPVSDLILEPGFYSLSFVTSNQTSELHLVSVETDFGITGDGFEINRFSGDISPRTDSNFRFIFNGQFLNQIVPQTETEGEFGVFNIDADGNWNYQIDTAAVETLVFGQSVSESFEIASTVGTGTETITVTVDGVNQAVIANDTTLLVAEDAVNGTLLGTVDASDPDGDAPAISITSGNEAGVFAVDAAGNVSVADASQLDFDITPQFVLEFAASDGLDVGTATLTISVTEVVPPVEDFLILGTSEDDTLFGNAGDNVLVGLVGSDILIGSAGNDVFITDEINGDNNNDDRDVIRLGNVDVDNTGNDVVTDFDVNGTNGGENNFDTLEFTFDGNDFSISTRNDIRRFVRFIETDGDVRTDAILDGNDLILVFGRDSDDPSIITSSVRLEDVVGQNGLTQRRLRRDSVDLIGTAELDVFFASGAVEIGSTASETLVGGAANDVIVGGAGSDTLFGGAGNDTLTGDQTNGGIFGNDQDTFAISEIVPGNVGNDVITDFDVNNFDGGENNFDTLTLTLGNQDFSLSTGRDFLEFAEFLDNDGNDDTGTLIDGDDIIFVFGRNELGFITDSVRLQDIIKEDNDGLTNASLAAFSRVGESGRLDVFIV